MTDSGTTDASADGPEPGTDRESTDRQEQRESPNEQERTDRATETGTETEWTAEGSSRTWILMGAVLAVLWLFVRGVEWIGHPIVVAEELLLGLVVGMPIAYLTRRMYADSIPLSDPIRSPAYVVVYVALFLKELVTANVDVAYRVLHPSMPIYPSVIEFPLRVETDLAITTIANSITLTPGTLTMDHDDGRNALYVHTIDGRDPEAVVEPIRQWEDYALVIFDERRSPGDPVPDPERVASRNGSEADESRDVSTAVAEGSSPETGASGDGQPPADRTDGGETNGG